MTSTLVLDSDHFQHLCRENVQCVCAEVIYAKPTPTTPLSLPRHITAAATQLRRSSHPRLHRGHSTRIVVATMPTNDAAKAGWQRAPDVQACSVTTLP